MQREERTLRANPKATSLKALEAQIVRSAQPSARAIAAKKLRSEVKLAAIRAAWEAKRAGVVPMVTASAPAPAPAAPKPVVPSHRRMGTFKAAHSTAILKDLERRQKNERAEVIRCANENQMKDGTEARVTVAKIMSEAIRSIDAELDHVRSGLLASLSNFVIEMPVACAMNPSNVVGMKISPPKTSPTKTSSPRKTAHAQSLPAKHGLGSMASLFAALPK